VAAAAALAAGAAGEIAGVCFLHRRVCARLHGCAVLRTVLSRGGSMQYWPPGAGGYFFSVFLTYNALTCTKKTQASG